MGAGAVGCYYGGMLARAGRDVTLIARPQHVEAIRRAGLRLETKSFDEHVRLQASSEPQALRGAELVLFCVKSQDTEAAGKALAGFTVNAARALGMQATHGKLAVGKAADFALWEIDSPAELAYAIGAAPCVSRYINGDSHHF